MPTAASATGKAGIVLSGSYEFLSYARNVALSYSYDFEASICGCAWIISCEGPTVSSDPKMPKMKWVGSCDGTNIYLVEVHDDDMHKKAWGDRYSTVKDQLEVATAEIFPGDFPPPARATELRHIWFALASGCVVGSTNGRMKTLGGEDLAVFYSTNCYMNYYWTNNTAEPGARVIVLQSDGHFFGRDYRTGETFKEARYAAPFDKGFTYGIGVYHQWTNVAATFVPIEFEFTAFTPKPDAKVVSDLEKWNGYKCTVSKFRSTVLERIPPDLPKGKVLVTDRRFLADGYATVNYAVTNGRWLAADDSNLVKGVAHTRKVSLDVEQGFAPARRYELRRFVIWCLLLFPLSALALKGLSKKLKRKRKQNEIETRSC